MQRRPRPLLALSFALVAVGLALPAQIMVLYGHTWHEFSAVAGKLTILNWLVIAGCLVTAFLVANASPLSRRAMLALTGVVAMNNFFVGYYAIDFSPFTAALGTLGFAALNGPLWMPEVTELIRQPHRRWWMRSHRHRLSLPLIIGSPRKVSLRAETFDVSETGLFIPLKGAPLSVDDRITLRLSFGTFARLRCEGRVVRCTEARGIYPSGVGIEFTGLDRRQRRELRRHLKEMTV
ncbi:MAG: PilZ domain-containing protein [Bdellovibrionales bacterium]|nr:PilZ domain-containing protein [Bdellovibrionales bacterium]